MIVNRMNKTVSQFFFISAYVLAFWITIVTTIVLRVYYRPLIKKVTPKQVQILALVVLDVALKGL